jgi:hypothetical protein
MAQSSLALSVPFVNYVWHSELFTTDTPSSGSEDAPPHDSISSRLSSLWERFGRLPDTLGALAHQMDGYQRGSAFLKNTTQRKLGLCHIDNVIGGGYGLKNRNGGNFLESMAMGAILDRFLATKQNFSVPSQSLHPHFNDEFASFDPNAYELHRGNLQLLASALATAECDGDFDITQIQPAPTASALSVTLSYLAVASHARLHLGGIICNIYVIALAILVLAQVSHRIIPCLCLHASASRARTVISLDACANKSGEWMASL